MTNQKKSVKNDDFFLAKEKLGLLSVGDPGTQDKIQVTDTFLVSAARKLDAQIKSHPRLKQSLVKIKRGASKSRNKLRQIIKPKASHQTSTTSQEISASELSLLVNDIVFKKNTTPKVSIIIPAFNKVSYSYSCLKSIYEKIDPITNPSFEVVLVDNGSSDDTPILGKIKNIVYVRNEENLGFVGGCNAGLAASKGEYVIYLNNDAEVTPEWLTSLYDTIESDESIGIVGSKIIYPNGVLQEAGGVIFKDADGLNFGKFDQAESYQYNYVREVDYCSGASIIIRRDLMNKFGGFDKLYHPAYYEDTDLCFKVRKEGLKVIYQPLSVIYHIEGGTAGTSTNSGFKKFQEINKAKFLKRWKTVLGKDHVASNESYIGRDRSGNKLALIIEETLPTPDKDSGSRRMVAMIESLQKLGYKVTFWPNDLTKKEPYAKNLQQMGVEVVYGNIDFMQFAKHYGHFYNLVIMSRPEICAKYINICRTLFTNAQLVYDTVDLHYIRLARQAEVETANAELLLEQSKWYEILEKGLMERVDATLVVSEKEVEILKDSGVNSKIGIVSNIHTIHDESFDVKFEERKDIVFLGNYAHLPNRDALIWFNNEIFPLIEKGLKNVKLHVVGANMPPEIEKSLTSKNYIVDGFVSDEELFKILQHSRVFVAPLRYGAGVKGKIGQSIEHGLPVVTTSIGAEGMYLTNTESCMEANDAAGFAKAVINLYDDKKLWLNIQKNAKISLVEHFSVDKATKDLEAILS
jgi:GT2 family glycosyltransferase/glycosyltransferase involved in cell wall biosynthesis